MRTSRTTLHRRSPWYSITQQWAESSVVNLLMIYRTDIAGATAEQREHNSYYWMNNTNNCWRENCCSWASCCYLTQLCRSSANLHDPMCANLQKKKKKNKVNQELAHTTYILTDYALIHIFIAHEAPLIYSQTSS